LGGWRLPLALLLRSDAVAATCHQVPAMAPMEFETSAHDELKQKGDSVLVKQWELLRHCCAENTQQTAMLKRMVTELATAVDEESSLRQADFDSLRQSLHAEASAQSKILGLEETLQGLVQDRVGKLEELLRAAIDKYDVELATERTARQVFVTEVQDMLEGKWTLQGQLQEFKLERDIAVLSAEFEQRQAKLAGEMQELAMATQKSLDLHKACIEERFCIEKDSHDSQVREVQSIKDFLADETGARQQQHRALEAAREQLQTHITRIIEDFGALREDKADPTVAHPLTASAHSWVQRPGGWSRTPASAPESLPTTVGARPHSPAASAAASRPRSPHCSPRSHCRTVNGIERTASVPPDSSQATLGIRQAEMHQQQQQHLQQQQQQQQRQQSQPQLQQMRPQLPQLQLAQLRSPKWQRMPAATRSPDRLDTEGSLEGVSSAGGRPSHPNAGVDVCTTARLFSANCATK